MSIVTTEDTDMGGKAKGLYDKFHVMRMDGQDMPGEKHDGCQYFVLDMTHDKHAPAAIRAYAESCCVEFPLLAADLYRLFPQEPRKG